jgi:hypothetical protein
LRIDYNVEIFLSLGLTVSIPGMEKALHQYTLEPSEKPFDMKSIPLAMAPVFEQKSGIRTVYLYEFFCV